MTSSAFPRHGRTIERRTSTNATVRHSRHATLASSSTALDTLACGNHGYACCNQRVGSSSFSPVKGSSCACKASSGLTAHSPLLSMWQSIRRGCPLLYATMYIARLGRTMLPAGKKRQRPVGGQSDIGFIRHATRQDKGRPCLRRVVLRRPRPTQVSRGLTHQSIPQPHFAHGPDRALTSSSLFDSLAGGGQSWKTTGRPLNLFCMPPATRCISQRHGPLLHTRWKQQRQRSTDHYDPELAVPRPRYRSGRIPAFSTLCCTAHHFSSTCLSRCGGDNVYYGTRLTGRRQWTYRCTPAARLAPSFRLATCTVSLVY